MRISIVTAVKNRPIHISKSAAAISASELHCEHIIVDWASDPPVHREELPKDKRIILIRVDKNLPWWLAGAYNLGFAIASGEVVLKSDADILLGPKFLSQIIENSSHADFSCGRLTMQDYALDSSLFPSSGLFWAKRQALINVRGFNPLIFGWGWDEIDLYTRLFSSGHTAIQLKQMDTIELKHSNEERKANLFNTPCYLGIPAKHYANLSNGISNHINFRISVYCSNLHRDFPSLDHYVSLLRQGNLFFNFFNGFFLSDDVLQSILDDCISLSWSHLRLHSKYNPWPYLRWMLRVSAYRRILLQNYIHDRIIPLASHK